MKRFIPILGLIVLATILIGSKAHAGEQARLEREGLTCPIDDNLTTMLDQYFKDNPIKPPEGEHWVRGIVLSKNRIHTNQQAIGGTIYMKISFLCYVQNGEINEYSSSEFDGLLDLKTPIGADIWIKEWNWNLEVKLISTQATCIPDSCIVTSESAH